MISLTYHLAVTNFVVCGVGACGFRRYRMPHNNHIMRLKVIIAHARRLQQRKESLAMTAERGTKTSADFQQRFFNLSHKYGFFVLTCQLRTSTLKPH